MNSIGLKETDMRVMTGWSASQALRKVGSIAPALQGGHSRFAMENGLSRRMLFLSVNILVALFYALFLYGAINAWLRTGSLISVGLVFSNTLLVAFLLTRRSAVAVTHSLRNWILAPLSQLLPLLLRPVGSGSWAVTFVSSMGQIAGIVVMIASLLALNRSIGVVAANRGIKTQGLYAWVRHPLYAGELVFFLSFLVSNWSYRNALLVLALILAQVVRSYHEETLLILDEQYVAYRSAVPHRLIPGIF